MEYDYSRILCGIRNSQNNYFWHHRKLQALSFFPANKLSYYVRIWLSHCHLGCKLAEIRLQMTVDDGYRKALYFFLFVCFFNKIQHKLKRKQIRWHFISLPAFSKHISKQNQLSCHPFVSVLVTNGSRCFSPKSTFGKCYAKMVFEICY